MSNKTRQAANLVSETPNNIFSDIDTGRVGIGSTQPTATLNVAGVVSATSYYGDGSNLTGISGGGGSFSVGFAVSTGATPYVVGTGVTQIDFVGAGYTTVSYTHLTLPTKRIV